jgi:hypothetical protein
MADENKEKRDNRCEIDHTRKVGFMSMNAAVQNVDDTGGKPFVVLAHVEEA